jgi:hypothetical protein
MRIRRRTEYHDRETGKRRFPAKFRENLMPILLGQIEVEDDEIRMSGAGKPSRPV